MNEDRGVNHECISIFDYNRYCQDIRRLVAISIIYLGRDFISMTNVVLSVLHQKLIEKRSRKCSRKCSRKSSLAIL